MKALSIPASGTSMSESMRAAIKAGSARVSRLRAAIPATVFLTVAIIAIIAFFFALGMMRIPYIVATGSTSLIAAALTPISQEGGAA